MAYPTCFPLRMVPMSLINSDCSVTLLQHSTAGSLSPFSYQYIQEAANNDDNSESSFLGTSIYN